MAVIYNFTYLVKEAMSCINKLDIGGSLQMNDVSIFSTERDQLRGPLTVTEGLKYGSKMLDLWVYLGANNKAGFTIKPRVGDNLLDDDKIGDAYKDAAYFIIYCLLRGSVPDDNAIKPAMINTIFGQNYNHVGVIDRISSFKISKFNFDFLMHMNMYELPSIIKNRLLLGMAGHRYLNIIRTFTPDKGDAKCDNIIKKLRNWIGNKHYWEIFPLTRSTHFTLAFPSFNKSLMNLIAHAYTQETLSKFVRMKLVPMMPEVDERYSGYLEWDTLLFPILVLEVNFNSPSSTKELGRST